MVPFPFSLMRRLHRMQFSWILFAGLTGCAWISDLDHAARLDQDGDSSPWPHDCDDSDPEVQDRVWYPDVDQDGFGTGDGIRSCEEQEGMASAGGDCNDNDPSIHPGAAEQCNEVDDDCDEGVDESPTAQQWYVDNDGDGYGVEDEFTWIDTCEDVVLHSRTAGDCDDWNSEIHPGAAEICDDEDTDCDGETRDEESTNAPLWYADADQDGYGDASASTPACDAPAGLIPDGSDCDDSNAAIHPAGQEVCDTADADEDCDGLVDDGDPTVDASTFNDLYLDADQDGFGSTPTQACDPDTGYSAEGGDCDDGDATVYPTAPEICDGLDNNCDALVDDDDPLVDMTSTSTWYPDEDNDDFGDAFHAGAALCAGTAGFPLADNTDCDDTRADVFPGGNEVCDLNDVDEDCDGLVDSNDPSVDASTYTSWYQDIDGDGYGTAAASVFDCDPPNGYGQGAEDCDDSDSSIFPGAQEVWYDNIDQDCNGLDDFDADQDGYADPQGGGTDCDDNNASMNPGASEICNDGLDNDCDPSTDSQCGLQTELSVGTAEASFLPEGTSDDHGAWVDAGTDVDGDSVPDLLIGAPGFGGGAGAAYLFYGPVSGAIDLAVADLRVLGAAASDSAGSHVAILGDMTGDGINDIAVGAPNRSVVASQAGSAYLVSGADTGNISLSNQSEAQLYGNTAQEQMGFALSTAGDFNSDGNADWLVGAPGSSSGDHGNVYVLYGPVSGALDTSQADVQIEGEQANDEAGWSIDGGRDITGDGFDDLLVGSPSHDKTSLDLDSGRAYVVEGSGLNPQVINLGDAYVHQLTGESTRDEAGITVSFAGDIDGDGSEDMLVGAYLDDDAVLNAGAAYLLLGPITGDLDLSTADAKLTGGSVSGHLGVSVEGAGDVNGDGLDDVLIGAEQEDLGGAQSGVVYVVLGPVSGNVGLGSGDARVYGQANDKLGHSISAAGDTNQDGFDDVLLGTDGHGAYLLLGGDL